MPYICYDDTKHSRGPIIPYDKINATSGYLRHFDNQCYLEFIATSPLASFNEKAQARKELLICERKMRYHRQHHNWNRQEVEAGIKKIKAKWNVK